MHGNFYGLIGLLFGVVLILKVVEFAAKQWQSDRRKQERKQFYNENYLDSEEWQRKRAVVLKRDRYRCVFCGSRATPVHHKRYARRNIGRDRQFFDESETVFRVTGLFVKFVRLVSFEMRVHRDAANILLREIFFRG